MEEVMPSKAPACHSTATATRHVLPNRFPRVIISRPSDEVSSGRLVHAPWQVFGFTYRVFPAGRMVAGPFSISCNPPNCNTHPVVVCEQANVNEARTGIHTHEH
jgi:hypothetical protein